MRGRAAALALIVSIVTPSIAAPQAPAPSFDEDGRALALARSAFEYRDFPRVIATLEPWVHPPRIADRARLAEAQRLLGVSLHITGDVARAEQEFARVLEFDPQVELDPFVVPPAVIETFERVRTSMRPVLDRILAERAARATIRPEPAPDPAPAALLSPIFAYAPLGLSHFLALEEPGWGALWLSLQALGLAANVSGYHAAAGLRVADGRGGFELDPADSGAFDAAVAIELAGLGLFTAAWIASGLHAHARWPDPVTGGPAPSPGAASLGLLQQQ